jgi:protein gp37
MVFVNSMSDLFHENVPWLFVAEIFAIMALAPQHTFQVLTKRPERAREILTDRMWWANVEGLAQSWHESRTGEDPSMWLAVHGPLPNVWMGVSIENARFTWRADVLREIPAAVRFISAEPLLGSLFKAPSASGRDDARAARRLARPASGAEGQAQTDALAPRGVAPLDLAGIDWLIVGGESGHGARPMQPEWARELRDECLRIGHQGIGYDRPSFFFKQWGGRTPKAGGRLLDGREWNEMPANASRLTAEAIPPTKGTES